MGRKCTICSDRNLAQINSLIGEFVPFRNIAKQIFGKVNRYTSVFRHASNCLGFDTQRALEERRIDKAIDAYNEFTEQLELTKELQEASRRALADENGEISLDHRATEIDVLYDDLLDRKANGEPKRKRENLDVILDKINGTGKYSNSFALVNTPDIFKYALDVFHAADKTIDRFAKMNGDYKEKEQNAKNVSDSDLAKELDRRLTDKGWAEKDRKEFISKRY